MENLFVACAVIGGTLVVCQFLMTLIGLGGHGGEMHVGDAHVGDFHGGELHSGEMHGEAHGDEAHGDEAHASPRGEGAHAAAHGHGPAIHAAGRDSHSPPPAEAAANWFVKMLSLRTIVAAVAFFGLTGKASLASGADTTVALAVAVGAGFLALYVVHWLMSELQELDSDGTVQIERAIGEPGTVNLSIPARNSGPGKIQLTLQNRLVELEAMTAGEPLANGAQVKVVGVLGPDTVAVEPLS